MKLKIFQIDAFADKVFSGNPAAVCIMDTWLDASLMQQIAAENNLAETAFVVKKIMANIIFVGLPRKLRLIYVVMPPLPQPLCFSIIMPRNLKPLISIPLEVDP